jgi:hypothetical protein
MIIESVAFELTLRSRQLSYLQMRSNQTHKCDRKNSLVETLSGPSRSPTKPSSKFSFRASLYGPKAASRMLSTPATTALFRLRSAYPNPVAIPENSPVGHHAMVCDADLVVVDVGRVCRRTHNIVVHFGCVWSRQVVRDEGGPEFFEEAKRPMNRSDQWLTLGQCFSVLLGHERNHGIPHRADIVVVVSRVAEMLGVHPTADPIGSLQQVIRNPKFGQHHGKEQAGNTSAHDTKFALGGWSTGRRVAHKLAVSAVAGKIERSARRLVGRKEASEGGARGAGSSSLELSALSELPCLDKLAIDLLASETLRIMGAEGDRRRLDSGGSGGRHVCGREKTNDVEREEVAALYLTSRRRSSRAV